VRPDLLARRYSCVNDLNDAFTLPSTASLRRRRVRQLAVATVIAAQVLAGAPVLAQDAARAAVGAASRASAAAEQRLAKARVRVNRTVPAVTPPNLDPMFGMNVLLLGRSSRQRSAGDEC